MSTPASSIPAAIRDRISARLLRHPQDNWLTGKPTNPNLRDVIDALARTGKVQVEVDGLTANDRSAWRTARPAEAAGRGGLEIESVR